MESTRRELLAALGAVAASAGCLAPTGDGGRVGVADETPTPSPATEPAGDATSTTEVYDRVAPSVGRIRTYVGESTGPFGEPGGSGGQGSGFGYGDGYVVTNDHVLGNADAIRVQGADGEWTEATIVGRDPYSDLAVLDPETPLPGGSLPVVDELPPTGSEVLAVGAPFGLAGSVSQGIVSGRNRTIPASTAAGNFSVADAIQIDAALNPGNSGGPIVSMAGEVVAVATATQGDSIGFGVSARLVEEVVPALIETGSYEHSFMGVAVLEVDPLIAEANGLSEARGVYVASVEPDGPADGVLQGTDGEETVDGAVVPDGGDTVVAIDGTRIDTNSDLSRFLALETAPGDAVDVTVLRDGEETTVELRLGPRPDPR